MVISYGIYLTPLKICYFNIYIGPTHLVLYSKNVIIHNTWWWIHQGFMKCGKKDFIATPVAYIAVIIKHYSELKGISQISWLLILQQTPNTQPNIFVEWRKHSRAGCMQDLYLKLNTMGNWLSSPPLSRCDCNLTS